jgi:hypothetical protein
MADAATTKIDVHTGYVIMKPHGTAKTVMKRHVALAFRIEIGGSSPYRMVVKFLPGSMSHPTWQSSSKVTTIKPSNLTCSCESNI